MTSPDLGPTGAAPQRKETGSSPQYAFHTMPPSREIVVVTGVTSSPQDPHVISAANEDVSIGIGAAARKIADEGSFSEPPANPDHAETEPQPKLLQPLRLGDYDVYQVTRPGRSEIPGEKFADMIERVGELDAGQREALAANPFSEPSRTALDAIFPDVSPLDQARAVILVQPPTDYDEAFAELSPDEEKEELYRYTDRAADMIVRYDTFIDMHEDDLWKMSPEEIYQQATTAVLSPEAQGSLSGYTLRTFRLMAVNLIGDLETFRPYKQRQDTEPEALTNEILGIPVSGDPIVDVRPHGIMITLDPEDYKLASSKFHMHDSPSSGLTLNVHGLPPALGRRLGIVTNYGVKHTLQTIRKDGIYIHEDTHIKTDLLRIPGAFKRMLLIEGLSQGGLPFAEELAEQRKFAKALGDTYLVTSQNEIIAYTAQKYSDITPDNLAIEPFNSILTNVRKDLTRRSNLTPEQKTEIYEAYENAYIQYLNNVRTHFWIASFLSSAADGSNSAQTHLPFFKIAPAEIFDALQPPDDSLTLAKAVALLQLAATPKGMNRLGTYLGIDPDKLHEVFQASQTDLTRSYVYSRRNHGLDEFRPKLREVAQRFPEEALPELCNTLCERNMTPEDVMMTTNTVGRILAMNHKNMSWGDLSNVQLALSNASSSISANPAYNEAKKLLDELFWETNRYIKGTQFQFEVAEFWDITQPPTIAQAAQYVSLLTGKNDLKLWGFFRKDIIPILGENPQGIPALIEIGRSAYFYTDKTAAINALRDNITIITPEQRPEVASMLSGILTVLQQKEHRYKDVAAELKNAAQSLLDSLKGSK